MHMPDLIQKKKHGGTLSGGELAAFVDGYTRGEIPDYQASALCMAIWFRGMTDAECAALTECMMRSGDTVDLSALPHTADKHSTGGVGDLTSLITAPIAAAGGLTVAKMSGRGLGHTGGTVDKLSSIPGFRTVLGEDEFLDQVRRVGIAIVGQTANLAPADKKLYALRDVTGTVDSIPLIASSVMSKKLAAGAESIVLDVKYGSGAFMKTPEDAERLAHLMVSVGKAHGRRMAALVTSMDFPLAPAIGNTIEVEEAVRILRGESPRGYGIRQVAVALAGEMLSLSLAIPPEEGLRRAEELLSSGAAYRKFLEWIAAQGGDVSVLEGGQLPRAPYTRTVCAARSGWISGADTEGVGMAACRLGAGRMTKEDEPDLTAGILLSVARHDRVEAGDPIATLFTSDPTTLDEAEQIITDAIRITPEAGTALPLILKTIH